MRPIPIIALASVAHLDGGPRLSTDRRRSADTITAVQHIIRRLTQVIPFGQSIATALRPYSAEWLVGSDHAAVQLHIADMLQAVD